MSTNRRHITIAARLGLAAGATLGALLLSASPASACAEGEICGIDQPEIVTVVSSAGAAVSDVPTADVIAADVPAVDAEIVEEIVTMIGEPEFPSAVGVSAGSQPQTRVAAPAVVSLASPATLPMTGPSTVVLVELAAAVVLVGVGLGARRAARV